MLKLQSHSTSNPTSFAQKAGVEALRGPQDSVEEMRAEYRASAQPHRGGPARDSRRQCNMPSGAFYVYPNVGAYLKKDGIGDVETLVERLLEEAHVALVPGPAFGTADHVRISYATSQEYIEEGLRRMKRFFGRF